MRVNIKVIPKARIEKVEELLPGAYKVWVRAAPEKGKANARVLELLAKYFKKPRSNINILQGKTSGYKIVEIL